MLLLVIPFAGSFYTTRSTSSNSSLRLNERSRSPGGLPYRWILKSVIPLAMGLFESSRRWRETARNDRLPLRATR